LFYFYVCEGYGFVEYGDGDSCRAAIALLDGRPVNGRPMKGQFYGFFRVHPIQANACFVQASPLLEMRLTVRPIISILITRIVHNAIAML